MKKLEIDKSAVWARVELGMPRSEFDVLTPAEWSEHVRLWRWKQYRDDVRLAQLRYTVAAAAGSTDKLGNPITLEFFMPDPPEGKKRRKRSSRPSGRELLKQFLAVVPKTQINDQRKNHGR